MPRLGKSTLTRYLGSDCQKQLRISLHPESGPNPERVQLGMPLKQPPRPGLQNIAAAGDEWAATRLAELHHLVGPAVLVGRVKQSSKTSGIEFADTPLVDSMPNATPGTFLVEHQFPVGNAFQQAFDPTGAVAAQSLTYDDLRPDLIEVRPAGTHLQCVAADGSIHDLADDDTRLQLRVIDIKLTSEPGPGYFAEVVYYSVALAGWLKDNGWDHRFVVTPDPAIWPGNHQASALWQASDAAKQQGTTLTPSQALQAVYEDLVDAPFPVFANTLSHFFTDTLPGVLSANWRDLPYHVSSKCRGCDFLGDDRGPNNQGRPDHCQPLAESSQHLSRIPFISRGATKLLETSGLGKVSAVATTAPTDNRYDQHHSLRAQRTIIGARAASLTSGSAAGLAPQSGTSAALPTWSDLNIYITADFDSSSAITVVLGLAGYWSESKFAPGVNQAAPQRKVWNRESFLVHPKSLKDEEQVLIAFLERIHEMLEHVRRADRARAATAANESTVQVYLWDDLTYRHLCRIVGRHLDAILTSPKGVKLLAWMFPPEELLANSRMLADPIVTVVSDAVKALVTLPVPHHYSLLETARHFHTPGMDPKYSDFQVPPLHEDPLSDQIPSERAHDLWKPGGNLARSAQSLDRTVRVRLQALEEVTKRLRSELKGQLRRRAPRQGIVTPPAKVSKLTPDELLILAFAKLNVAVDAQDNARRRAMPPHEREARFSSMRLTKRLTGQDRVAAFAQVGLTPQADLEVYRVRSGSTQANFKEGDFTCALVKEDRVEVLDWRVGRYVKIASTDTISATSYGNQARAEMSKVLGAALIKFDRDNQIAVIEMDDWNSTTRRALIADGLLDLDKNMSLEKVSRDFLTPKLAATLQAIGNTPKAMTSPLATRALGFTGTGPRATPRVPVEDVLWDAAAMEATPVARNAAGAKAALDAVGRSLNPHQWIAFTAALTHRLTLIWGPPGTGKSRTVTNIILGAAHDATAAGKPLRVLVSANTYTAIDNVLTEVADECANHFTNVEVWRARSQSRPAAASPVLDCAIENNASTTQQTLLDRLTNATTEVTVVGASPQQAHRLACSVNDDPAEQLFDLIVIDEASQIDVANAILPLALLAENGSVVVAGDPLQLPPIHQVAAPAGTEHLVGSIYDYLAGYQGVGSLHLLTNYRSNAEIVGLGRDADYPQGLTAHSPSLRLNLLAPIPTGPQAPAGWPNTLPWFPDLARLLDPSTPVTCLVYKDGLSGQSNPFEAQLVAGLAWLLDNRLADALDAEVDPQNQAKPSSTTPYTTKDLLTTGVGVVTPHRAQQSMITTLLTQTFPNLDPSDIRASVDTVERFQGQQRDVIIASYAVGDPDTVAEEDEFLQSLNRFNVMVSRARAKIIVLMSEELVRHLPRDIEILRASRLVKAFAETRCRNRSTVNLGVADPTGAIKPVTGSLRWT